MLIEGRGEPDMVIMQGYPGVISKAGAEGVGCASLPDGRGVAVKVLDGNDRATGPALAALLARCLGRDDVPAAVVPVARRPGAQRPRRHGRRDRRRPALSPDLAAGRYGRPHQRS